MITKKIILTTTIVLCSFAIKAQEAKTKKFSIGYETLEMVMNKFQYFAGEVAYTINDKKQIRLMIGEVKLTENHLSSKWQAAAVDGENVEGYLRIYELYYDRFFGKRKNFYYSGSIAYVRDKYTHLISDKRIDHETPTIGFAIGYRKTNLFGIENLYINASIPFRYYIKDIPKQQWGDTKILPHKFVNNIWFFVGINF